MTGRLRNALIYGGVALGAALAGFAYQTWRTAPDAAAPEAHAALAQAQFSALDGTVTSVGRWRGKVVLVNFWATWCAPCREEIPLLVKLQDQYGAAGLQVVGIAIDQPEKVRPYALEMGMNFPVLIGGADAIGITRALGNRAGVLPYTVVLTRQGEVATQVVGLVRESAIVPVLTRNF